MTAIASEDQAPKQILGLEARSLRTPNFVPYGPTRPAETRGLHSGGPPLTRAEAFSCAASHQGVRSTSADTLSIS